MMIDWDCFININNASLILEAVFREEQNPHSAPDNIWGAPCVAT